MFHVFVHREKWGYKYSSSCSKKKKHVKDFDTLFFFFKLAKYYLGLKWTDKGGIHLLERV